MSKQHIVNIKQRIVGAIVLVSLGVIILPLLLNGGTITSGISRTNIPPKPKALIQPLAETPAIKKMPAPKIISNKPVYKSKPIKVAVIKNTDNSNKSATAKKNAIVSKKSSSNKTKSPQYQKMSKPASDKINVAYTLQVASFSQKSNALNLRDKLRKKGFKAYSESIPSKTGRVYRLRVGPYLKYDQILSAKKKIEKQFKLSKTVIVKYKT